MKNKTLAFVVLCLSALNVAEARLGHFRGFYAGVSLGQQNVSTAYNLANAQFGNIAATSNTSNNTPATGDTTTITTTPVYVNGKGTFIQRGMTGAIAVGGGMMINQVYFGLEVEGAYGLGVNQPPIVIENVGEIDTIENIEPGATSGTTAVTNQVTNTTYFDLTTTLSWKPKMRLSGAFRLGYLVTPKVMVFVSAGMARTSYSLTSVNTLYTANSAIFGNGVGTNPASYASLSGATQVTTATGQYANLSFTPVSRSGQSNAIVLGLGTEIAVSSNVNLRLKGEYEIGQSIAKTLNLKPSVLGLKFGVFYYF